MTSLYIGSEHTVEDININGSTLINIIDHELHLYMPFCVQGVLKKGYVQYANNHHNS